MRRVVLKPARHGELACQRYVPVAARYRWADTIADQQRNWDHAGRRTLQRGFRFGLRQLIDCNPASFDITLAKGNAKSSRFNH